MKRKDIASVPESGKRSKIDELPLSSKGELIDFKLVDQKVILKYRHNLTSEEETKALSLKNLTVVKEVELKKDLSPCLPKLDEYLNAFYLKNATAASAQLAIKEDFDRYAKEHGLTQDWKSFKETAEDSHEFFKICSVSYLRSHADRFKLYPKDSLESWMEVIKNFTTFKTEASIIWSAYLELVPDFDLGSKLDVALDVVLNVGLGFSFMVESLLNWPPSDVIKRGLREDFHFA